MKDYWFKPKRFWRWFAAYYPSAWQGWLVTLMLFYLLVSAFIRIDQEAGTTLEAVYSFIPAALLLLLIFDLITRLTGQYPSWWRRKR